MRSVFTSSRYKKKVQPEGWTFVRRDRDSNPGYPCEVRLFSKQVLSATQASLQY